MTREEFIGAYNIGHRDGKVDVYCPNDYDDIFDIEQEPCEDCCNGNQEEKAKLCQKSYIAGMEHTCEDEKIIRIKKGTLKARTGRYVIYDVEWLKTHFNTTEAKIYGQPQPKERTEEGTETHACDYISRQAVLEITAETGALETQTRVKALPPVNPQQKIGHWILSGGYWRCSECGEKALLKLDKAKGNCKEYVPVKSKYCPECGSYNGDGIKLIDKYKGESEDKE